MKNPSAIQVQTSLPDLASASKIAVMLVEKHLAACVQVIPGITSYYFWNNRLHSDPEYLLIIKTVSELFEAVKEAIIKDHPYDVPEIIALEVKYGHGEYLEWIREVTVDLNKNLR